MSRGMGKFDVNDELESFLENTYICDHHVSELGTRWGSFAHHYKRKLISNKRLMTCSFPDDILPVHNDRMILTKNSLPRLTSAQAREVYQRYGTLLHVGLRKFYPIIYFPTKLFLLPVEIENLAICSAHSKAVQQLIDGDSEESEDANESAFEEDMEEPSTSSNIAEKSCYAKDDSRSAFTTFAKSIGITRFLNRKPFDELSGISKYRKALNMRKMEDWICKEVAGSKASEFKEMVHHNLPLFKKTRSDTFVDNLMEKVAFEYNTARTARSRMSSFSDFFVDSIFRSRKVYSSHNAFNV